jgi:predicted enzyme related to lactoylglutathione lyase
VIAFRPDNFDAILGHAIPKRNDGEIERRRNPRYEAANHRHANFEWIDRTRLNGQNRTEHRRAKGSVGIGHVSLRTATPAATLPEEGDVIPPTYANGKICYIEIPATDIERSAEFYTKAFGWTTRKRGNGHLAFDDTTGQVSGVWVTGRPPSPTPGLLIYIMVDDVNVTIDAILANGGEIVQPVGADAPEITARFRDPGGNVLGLYQEPR